jgi:hypothetical protein
MLTWRNHKQEAVYSKDLYPLNQFLSQRESIYYWSYAGAAFNWGLGRIGINVTNPGNRGVIHGQFVVVKNIEVHQITNPPPPLSTH